MSRSVLVVEPDFDALGTLASSLRERGLEVAIADGPHSAIERARAAPPDAVLVAARIIQESALKAKFAADPLLAGAAFFTLYTQLPDRELHADELDVSEVQDIARRMLSLPTRAGSPVAESGDLRGNLEPVPAEPGRVHRHQKER